MKVTPDVVLSASTAMRSLTIQSRHRLRVAHLSRGFSVESHDQLRQGGIR
jgi:hypothetical protein